MIREYISSDQNFSLRTRSTYATIFFFIPLGSLSLTAIGYVIANGLRTNTRSTIGRILEGISYMDTTSILVSLGVGILIMMGLIVFLKSYYRNRDIVVALKFDDQAKQLTITTRRIDGKTFVSTHPYAELSLECNHLSDGMTSPMYRTLTLVKDGYFVGHVYMDHFTWEDAVAREIDQKLKKCVSSLA